MLLAAGFAPAYHERKLSDPELAPVRKALDLMLAQQSPYPALVVDRLWNLQMANASASGLIRWLLDISPDHELPTDGTVNVLKMMCDANGLRQFLVNWQAVCSDLLHWIQREAMSDGPGSDATSLLDELLTLVGRDLCVETPDLDRQILPFLPVRLRKDGVDLNLFTTIATLGTPRDVTLHELRVESFFAADDATSEWFRARA